MQPLYAELSDDQLSEQLKVHRRNYEILAQQVAGFGKQHAPVHKLTELDDEQSSIKAVLAEYKRRSATPPPPKSPAEADQSMSGKPLLQPSQNIRVDLLLARVLIRRGDNLQRAWSTLQSVLLADAAQGEAWHMIGQLLDDPAQRANALERAARHGYGGNKKRNWNGVILWGVLSLVMLISGLVIVVSWLQASQRRPITGGMMVVAGSGLVVFACLTLFCLNNLREDWTRDRAAAERLKRRSYMIISAAMLGMTLFILINLAAMYRQSILGLPIADSWITNLIIVSALTGALMVTIGPLAFIEIFPELILSRGLARFFDGGVVGMGVILAGLVTLGRAALPWWILGSAAIVGLSLIGIALISYGRGDSFFDAILDIATARKPSLIDIPKPPPTSKSEQPHWAKLIRKAIFAVGGWIILAVIGAIIELYVQDWWQRIFK
jgi:hypothetical protein